MQNAPFRKCKCKFPWCQCPLQGCRCKVYSWWCKATPCEDADANLLFSMQNASCGYVMMWMPTCGYVMMQMLFIWHKCKLTKDFFLFFFYIFSKSRLFPHLKPKYFETQFICFFQRSILFNLVRLKYPVHHSCLQTCFILT